MKQWPIIVIHKEQSMMQLPKQHSTSNNMNSNCSNSSSLSSSNSITPPPLLLLEGDEIFLSIDGKSHTLYELKRSSYNINDHYNNDDCSRISSSDVQYRSSIILEEVYDVENARKTITLHHHRQEEGQLEVCDSGEAKSFDIQEIHQGVLNGCGTGSMSWDSGIVMGLYFHSNPNNELCGNILELGSGVGLGSSLLLCAAASAASSSIYRSSVTLTDVNKDVLHILKQNIARNINLSKEIPITVQHLDWFDYLGDDNIPIQTSSSSDDSNSNMYNTIIASDCIYLHEQILPLAETITKLLRRNNGNNKLHSFPRTIEAILFMN